MPSAFSKYFLILAWGLGCFMALPAVALPVENNSANSLDSAQTSQVKAKLPSSKDLRQAQNPELEKTENTYNSVEEFGQQKTQENTQAEVLKKSFIPVGCRLKSYFQNGTMGRYVCDGKDVFVGVVPPNVGLDEKTILENTTKTPGCATQIKDSMVGKFVYCQTPTHEVMQNYVRTNNSGLILTAVVPDGFLPDHVVALENYTLEIYFYMRGIAVSQERIKNIGVELSKAQECVESTCLWQ